MSILFLTTFFRTISAPSNPKLIEGDSLFNQNKFQEAFTIYNNILEENRQFSPKMLLKMAFIKENEGDFTNTLYYLNLYYLFKADKKVLDKMMDLASDNELKGYKFTDAEFFYAFFQANLYYVFGGVLATFLFLLVLIIKNKINKRDVLIPSIFLTSFIALFFFTINFGLDSHKGIITNDNTFLMDEPSAGANLVEKVGKGHRVEILSKNDIWYEILWDKEKVYIRENNLALIN